jgi:hypothetical protein
MCALGWSFIVMNHPEALRAYLARVGAEVINFRKAIIKDWRGHYYKERCLIRIKADGDIICSVGEYAPTKEERAAIKSALAEIDFPKTIVARREQLVELKELTRGGVLYEFTDRPSGGVVMVQETRREKSGSKHYIPWVFMSDGVWRAMEPDSGLPFWKPDAGSKGARIMIHEGAKAAAAACAIVAGKDPHPWKDELSLFEHWGMIGGALAPHRTNYEELRREAPAEVVYACDRDRAGESALQKVSKHWGGHLKGLKYSDRFPESWDIADPMPKKLFGKDGRYLGPRLAELLSPATWATEKVPTGEGGKREVTQIRSDFADEWLHCVRPAVFIHKEWPNELLTAAEFDNKVRPFSHATQTSALLMADGASKASVLRYDPREKSGVYVDGDNGHYINTHTPSRIVAQEGDCSLWEDFIHSLVRDESDRQEVIRWCATLVCRPEVRMLYGMLMISEKQGIGKGTLGEKILAPLVGAANVSYPSEAEVVESQFNYWLSHKRLAVVHEIYAGQSSKAYNKLKNTITDKFVTVSQKYMASYMMENWIHIFACSNSRRALKLSADDRRWFVPQLSEKKQNSLYWKRLNNWLVEEDGLGKIKWWMEQWLSAEGNEPVIQGADAPWSTLKKELVEEGYSPGQTLVAQKLEELGAKFNGEGCFVLDTDLVAMIRQQLYDGRFNDRLERPLTVRTVAKTLGWHIGETRAQVAGWGKETFGGRVIASSEELATLTPGQLAEKGLKPVRVADAI